jgi:ABC-2 type transport system permease protein
VNDFFRLTKKELRELARPQHLLPLLITPLLLVIVMQGTGAIQEQASQEAVVAVVNNDGDKYGQMAVKTLERNANVTYSATSVSSEKAIETVQSGPAQVLIVVPDGFTERITAGKQGNLSVYWSVNQINLASGASSAKTSALLEAIDKQLALAITGASPTALDVSTSTQTTYVRGMKLSASPAELSATISLRFFFLSLVMVIAIIGAGQLMIQGMGSEKEAKTLETLLTMPVKRRTIVAAKLASGSVLGLLLAGLYTGAIYFARPSSTGGLAVVPQLSGVEYLLIGVLLALAIVDILAVALWLGVFVDDSRGAQTLMLPLMFVVMAPVFVSMYLDISSFSLPVKAALFAIPATYPVLAPQRLLFGDPTIVFIGIVYEIVFAIVMIGLVVRLFNSDRLVTGETGIFGTLVGKFR